MTTLSIDPLTRVEGHGRIEIDLENRHAVAVRVGLNEPTRLFEGLLRGREWHEVPALACRICSICSSVHRIAAAAAIEAPLKVEVPLKGRLLRELLLLGGLIESHALHLFALVLPDIVGVPGLLDLLRDGNEGAEQALNVKRLGNRIQEVVGGRAIHPVTVEVGGMTSAPPRSTLEELLIEIDVWRGRGGHLLTPFHRAESFPTGTTPLGTRLRTSRGGYNDFGGSGLFCGGKDVPASSYRTLLDEQIVAHSRAKQAQGESGPFLTGPLTRVEASGDRLDPSLTSIGIHATNAARAIELQQALARAHDVIIQLLGMGEGARIKEDVHPGAGVGTAIFEAPRGVLIHHYVLDTFGRIALADIVTPTAINQVTMEQQLLADLQGVEDEEEICRKAERIVRAYDPCISCAVHLLHR